MAQSISSFTKVKISSPKMVVAILYGYDLNIGGVESHLLSLLQHSSSDQLTYLILAPFSERFAHHFDAYRSQLLQWRPRHSFDFVAFVHLIRLLRSLDVHLLHIHSSNAALLGAVAARIVGIPCVLTVHLPAYYLAQTRIKRRLYQVAEFLLQRLSSQVIYVSSVVRLEALTLGIAPKHSLVINNGVEVDLYPQHIARPLSPQFTICYVGRMEKQKGVDVLLHAIALLALPQLNVRLVGDGSQREFLVRLTTELKIDSQVEFLGSADAIPHMLAMSDIFVLPSRYEALSMALLEAMASGLPCVATTVGENTALITNGQEGLLVPPDDPSSLASAIKLLLTDADLRIRMGRAARLKAEQYSARRMAERTFAVYESLLP